MPGENTKFQVPEEAEHSLKEGSSGGKGGRGQGDEERSDRSEEDQVWVSRRTAPRLS